MAIVTVHQSFGDDKFPIKAEKLSIGRNHYKISESQIKLVCEQAITDFMIDMRTLEDGKTYAIFHKANLNFL